MRINHKKVDFSKNNGAKLESENSAELIVFNMIAGRHLHLYRVDLK